MPDIPISSLPLTPYSGNLVDPVNDYILVENSISGITYKAYLGNIYNLWSPLILSTGYDAFLDKVQTTLTPLPTPLSATRNQMFIVTNAGTNTTRLIKPAGGAATVGIPLIEGDVLVNNGLGSYDLIRTTTVQNNMSFLELSVRELSSNGTLIPSADRGIVLIPGSSCNSITIPPIASLPTSFQGYDFFIKNNSSIEATITFSDELEYVGSGKYIVTLPIKSSFKFEAVPLSNYWIETSERSRLLSSDMVNASIVTSSLNVPPTQTLTIAGANSLTLTLPNLSLVSMNQIFCIKSSIYTNTVVNTYTGQGLDFNKNLGTHNSTNLSPSESLLVIADSSQNSWLRLN